MDLPATFKLPLQGKGFSSFPSGEDQTTNGSYNITVQGMTETAGGKAATEKEKKKA